ncbi:hypothetical protein DVH24_025395 [Malus domestica]|uniref:Uncharacterized protein n=1 Tax=Malus domestica TaxID=3750 RepID=A0A498HNM3_MALDO|nr:hypothetical protein DVH24_025395 [Malus domestica]
MDKGSTQQMELEETYMSHEIKNIVASEGEERVIRRMKSRVGEKLILACNPCTRHTLWPNSLLVGGVAYWGLMGSVLLLDGKKLQFSLCLFGSFMQSMLRLLNISC